LYKKSFILYLVGKDIACRTSFILFSGLSSCSVGIHRSSFWTYINKRKLIDELFLIVTQVYLEFEHDFYSTIAPRLLIFFQTSGYSLSIRDINPYFETFGITFYKFYRCVTTAPILKAEIFAALPVFFHLKSKKMQICSIVALLNYIAHFKS